MPTLCHHIFSEAWGSTVDDLICPRSWIRQRNCVCKLLWEAKGFSRGHFWSLQALVSSKVSEMFVFLFAQQWCSQNIDICRRQTWVDKIKIIPYNLGRRWIEAALLFYELFMFNKLELESVLESECPQCWFVMLQPGSIAKDVASCLLQPKLSGSFLGSSIWIKECHIKSNYCSFFHDWIKGHCISIDVVLWEGDSALNMESGW